MEAFMYRCNPQTAKLVELIRQGAIGEVRMIQATFSFKCGYLIIEKLLGLPQQPTYQSAFTIIYATARYETQKILTSLLLKESFDCGFFVACTNTQRK